MLKILECQMREGCTNSVTHIGAKGYTYCASCAPLRRGFERTRQMRQWEKNVLMRGGQIFYEPLNREAFRLRLERLNPQSTSELEVTA